MARIPKPPASGDIAQTVAALNAKVTVAVAVGGAAIALGVAAALSIMGQLSDLNRSMGRAEGALSVQDQLGQISKTLQEIEANQARGLPVQPSPPAQHTKAEPTPDTFDGLFGVVAPNAAKLGKAMYGTAEDAGPVWLYTPDAKQAATLEQALKN